MISFSWSSLKRSAYLFPSDGGLSQNNILSKVKNSSYKPLLNCTFSSCKTLHTCSNISKQIIWIPTKIKCSFQQVCTETKNKMYVTNTANLQLHLVVTSQCHLQLKYITFKPYHPSVLKQSIQRKHEFLFSQLFMVF